MTSAPPPAAARPLLARLFERWHGRLSAACRAGVAPLLRIEAGAELVRDERAVSADRGLVQLLALAGPCLAPGPGALAATAVRPKVHAALLVAGGGLLVSLRYYGEAPHPHEMAAVRDALGTGACVLPPAVAAGEVRLRIVLAEPARRLPVVIVRAGAQELALPMSAIARACGADSGDLDAAGSVSLTSALGVDSAYAPGRPALLALRGRGAPRVLRVDELVGHEVARVLPAGPLLWSAPWLLGILARDDEAPVPVIEPLALLRAGDGG